jgi:hypothetical protein
MNKTGEERSGPEKYRKRKGPWWKKKSMIKDG